MSNPTTKITPTAAAIENATRRAATLIADGYSIKQSKSVPETWFVIKPGGQSWYLVNTRKENECDCPYYGIHGICKHSVAVAEELRILEMEQAYEDHFDMIASRDN
jgi:hypothetical protein